MREAVARVPSAAKGSPGTGWRRNDAVVLVAIAVAYGLIWPVGEYAINDDWAYFKSLTELHEQGKIRILHWNPMSLVGHLFWGLAFTKVLGLSFTVARLSVVVMHVIESLVLLRLLKLFDVGADLALAAVLALIFNPLHFVHAFSFMTDVPALTWQVIALYAYGRGLLVADTGEGRSQDVRRARLRWFVLGSLAVGAGFLIRQSGILVPAALLVYLVLFQRRLLDWRSLSAALGPAAVVVVAFTAWYQRIHGPTAAYVESMREIVRFTTQPPFADLPFIAFALIAYVGWFVIPLAVSLPRQAYRLPAGTGAVAALAVIAVAISALIFFALRNKVFPYMTNVVTPFGLGLNNEYLLGLRDVLWSKNVGLAISVLCLFSALMLLRVVLGARTRSRSGPTESPSAGDSSGSAGTSIRPAAIGLRFVSVLLVLELLYSFATTPILFDRHLLLLAPAALVVFCIAAGNVPLGRLRYLACIIPLAAYSITTTHDLHASSKAVFQAGRDLIARGVDPRQLLGGYAFDGWTTYDLRTPTPAGQAPAPIWQWWNADLWKFKFLEGSPTLMHQMVPWPPWGWWKGTLSAGDDKKYALSCSQPPIVGDRATPYRILGRYPYRNWWPWKMKTIYVLGNVE